MANLKGYFKNKNGDLINQEPMIFGKKIIGNPSAGGANYDFNTITETGFYCCHYMGMIANGPAYKTGGDWGVVLVFNGEQYGNYMLQLVFNYNTNKVFFRGKYDGTWKDWVALN